MQLDFEGILKYFRVSLPKKCRTEESAKQLMKLACSVKVKRLKKYEAEFIALKGKYVVVVGYSFMLVRVDLVRIRLGVLKCFIAFLRNYH